MPPKPAKSTAVATQATVPAEARRIDVFKNQLELATPTLMNLVPQHVPMAKFKAMVVTAVAYDSKLLDCTSQSLLRATAEAAELGLSLNKSLKEADILPVWNKNAGPEGKGAFEAQMRPRYMGLMKLAKQSGEIAKVRAVVVYEKDRFIWDEGLNDDLQHTPLQLRSKKQIIRDLWGTLGHEPAQEEIDAAVSKESRGLKTHAYCVWELKDGVKQFEVMEADRIEAIRERSPAGKSGPWVSDEDEMWRKTVVRRASKYMPLSAEFAKAVHLDNVRETEDGFNYTDVTDVPMDAPQRPAAPSTSARSQVDKLADRVAGPEAARITPAQELDGPDWLAWKTAMIDAASKMPTENLESYVRLHEDLISDAPEDIANSIRKAYNVRQ